MDSKCPLCVKCVYAESEAEECGEDCSKGGSEDWLETLRMKRVG